MAVFFSSGMPANDGIGAVGFSSVRRIAAFGSFSPMSVRSGPGPSLPLCPILWHARQPDCATTSFPASYFCGDLHVDLVRRAGRRAQVGEVAHRHDREDARDRRDRAPLRAALGAAIDERQEDQQDDADRRHADRGERRQDRRLDHAQQLEEEEEVPLRPRDVGGRRRVRLGPELRPEHQRHHDDREQDDARHERVLRHRVGEERLPLRLQQRVLAEVLLLLPLVHA